MYKLNGRPELKLIATILVITASLVTAGIAVGVLKGEVTTHDKQISEMKARADNDELRQLNQDLAIRGIRGDLQRIEEGQASIEKAVTEMTKEQRELIRKVDKLNGGN